MKARYRYRNKKNSDDKFRSHSSQSAILKSGYSVNQTWKAFSKAWLGYTIAKNKEEGGRMRYYVSVIQKLRKELGLPPASFPHIVTDEDITYVQQQKEFRK
ncbi:MAG: hypothetical protein WBE34_14065 [Candidatus Nitrosopolaris sp.]